ncbi:MAG: dienelactone hydrolase family protein [Myxococcales bacterium]|nr:dienelactone hydrolase family protein [Myxococcales bacterium]
MPPLRPMLVTLSLAALCATSPARAQAAAPRFAEADSEVDDLIAPEEGVSDEGGADQPWCVQGDGIEALTPTVCHYSPTPAERAPDTLVIFLHGLTKLGTTWQWNGQRGLARAAKAHGFEVITPRGRLGAGSSKYADHWNWPSSAEGQNSVEPEVLAEWKAAQELLEKRNGRPFARVWVWGFSAGAYYATSLALRGRVPVAGYAVFAGGGAPKGVERWAKGTRPKPPVYVGYGHKDRARKDPARLGRALRAMGWKSMVVGRPGVGHSMTDAQVREAVAFLQSGKAPRTAPPPKAPARPAGAPKIKKRRG